MSRNSIKLLIQTAPTRFWSKRSLTIMESKAKETAWASKERRINNFWNYEKFMLQSNFVAFPSLRFFAALSAFSHFPSPHRTRRYHFSIFIFPARQCLVALSFLSKIGVESACGKFRPLLSCYIEEAQRSREAIWYSSGIFVLLSDIFMKRLNLFRQHLLSHHLWISKSPTRRLEFQCFPAFEQQTRAWSKPGSFVPAAQSCVIHVY